MSTSSSTKEDSNECQDEEDECMVQVVEEPIVTSDVKADSGNKDDWTKNEPPRLLIVSSKVKNLPAIQGAIHKNITLVTYKYEITSLDGLLGLIAQTLGTTKVESIALILQCSGNNIYLCGKDDKTITKETILEQQSVREFFKTLVTNHLDKSWANARLDFLQNNVGQNVDGGLIAREIEEFLDIPVGLSKDINGADIPMTRIGEENSNYTHVGSLYFRFEKLKTVGSSTQTLAGFEKIRTVGKGAYGAAVLYRKKDDDSLVILKEINMHDLNATERQLALNEIKVLAMLDHPNIISYYDSFEEDGTLMIEMEYADGGNLAQYLAGRDKSLEEKEILSIGHQLIAALRHIHDHNVLHRDLKTANIFLTKDGIVKVGDFGIAKMLTTANKGANTVLGTPYYISPEMCEGKKYNDKSDIWALGCILYEMACLQKTFEGSNLPALVNKIMKGQFAPVKGNYSPEFKNLIKDMLEREPQYRPTAHDLWNNRFPSLMNKFDDPITDHDDDLTISTDGSRLRKKVRSVLYYVETDEINIVPTELPPRIKIRQVAVGNDHTIVVTNERAVYTWGEGSKGQLGHGDLEARYDPQLVEALTGKSITKACCGDGFSIFASDNGIVMTCGEGTNGCLGHGDWCSASRPRLIEALLSVDVWAVACGPLHVVIVGSQGEVFSWGRGASGRLGHGDETDRCEPKEVEISEPVTIRDVKCGIDGTMLLTDVGSVLACGSNKDNKLGLNQRQGFLMAMKNIFNKNEVEGAKSLSVVRALARHRVVSISMGPHHSAVLVESGHLYMFGKNSEAQLGTGNTKPQNAPIEVKILGDKAVSRVQCAEFLTVVSTLENELLFWGTLYKKNQNPSIDESTNKTTEMRIESAGSQRSGAQSHSRQPSVSSLASLTNSGNGKENDLSNSSNKRISSANESQTDIAGLEDKKSSDRQTSVDSTASSLSSSNNLEISQSSKYNGFRPLSSTPRRTRSVDSSKEDAMLFSQPKQLLMMDSEKTHGDETISLSSFYCYGEHIFVQVETTAPHAPPKRRRSKRKNFTRSRLSDSQLGIPVRSSKNSASSRDAGSENSSEASEIDTLGTIPAWVRQEFSDAQKSSKDDSEESSDDDEGDEPRLGDSLSSIHINKDLKKGPKERGKNIPAKKRLQTSSNESGIECIPLDNFSSESSDTEREDRGSKKESTPTKKRPTSANQRKLPGPSPYKSKVGPQPLQSQKPLNRLRAQNKGRGNRVGDSASVKEAPPPSPKGFLSEVTHKKREDAMVQELELLQEEKAKADAKLRELEYERQLLRDKYKKEAEIKSKEREKELEGEVNNLKNELLVQSNKMQENYNVVLNLQEQLVKLQQEQMRINAREQRAKSARSQTSVQKESKICNIS